MGDGPWIYISQHAYRRARERFPALEHKPKEHLKRLLVAVAFKGEPFGESVIEGNTYRKGELRGGLPIILALREDTDRSGRVVVTTVLTEEEARKAGPYREDEDADTAP